MAFLWGFWNSLVVLTEWAIRVIWCGMVRFFCWLLTWTVDDVILPFLDTVLEELPEPPVVDLWMAEEVGNVIAYWVPWTYLVTMYAAYGTWKIAFLCYRTIKKHIPLISG